MEYFVNASLRSAIQDDEPDYDLWPVFFGDPDGDGEQIAEFTDPDNAQEYVDWKNEQLRKDNIFDSLEEPDSVDGYNVEEAPWEVDPE